jgi:hypothetical protein
MAKKLTTEQLKEKALSEAEVVIVFNSPLYKRKFKKDTLFRRLIESRVATVGFYSWKEISRKYKTIEIGPLKGYKRSVGGKLETKMIVVA